MPVARGVYYEFCPYPSGPTVLFANSLGTDLTLWDAQVAALDGKRGILRYDMRGHGRSPSTSTKPSIDGLVDEVLGVMDAANIETVDYVGLSLGGLVGLCLASRYPERVSSLALCATAHVFQPAEFWLARAQTARQSGLSSIVEASRTRWFTPKFRSSAPDQVERVLAKLAAVDPESYAQCCVILAETDLSEHLSSIDRPTLLIAGAEDTATPPSSLRAIGKELPSSRYVEIASAAHMINISHPHEFGHVLEDFWATI